MGLKDRALWFAVVVAVVVVVALAASRLINERLVLTAILTDVPQVLYLPLPALTLLVAAIARRPLAIVVAGAGVAVVVVFAMGLRVNRASAAPHDLRVATFNIAKFEFGSTAVAATLRALDADVICLQEAGAYHWLHAPEQQPSTLIAAMPGYQAVADGELLVLSRRAPRWSLAHPIPPGPAARPLLELVFEVDDQTVSVFCAHLVPTLWEIADSVDRGEAHDADLAGILKARRSVAQRVNRIVSSSSSSSKILLGDMNTHPHALVGATLRGELSDAFAVAGTGFGYTLGPGWPRARYDQILIEGAEVLRADVVDSAASDHLPFVADLRVASP